MDSKPPDQIMTYREMWSKAIATEYFKAAQVQGNQEFFLKFEKQLRESAGSPVLTKSSPTSDLIWKAAPKTLELAGQAAAMAFAPATVVTSALNLLVEAGKEYHDLFDNIGQIKKKCLNFIHQLDRHESFEDHDHGRYAPHLKKIEFEQLCCHLRICGFLTRYAKNPERYIRPMGKNTDLDDDFRENPENKSKFKRALNHVVSPEKQKSFLQDLKTLPEKTKLFFKILAGNNEINDELDNLDALGKQLGEERDDDGYLHIKKMCKAQDQRSNEEKLFKRLQKIKMWLNIDEQNDRWKSAHADVRNSHKDEMGRWIMNHPLLEKWTDFDSSTDYSIVKMVARQKEGKTFLCYRVIKELYKLKMNGWSKQSKPSTDSDKPHTYPETPVFVAYYYFGKHGSDKKEGPTIDSAVAAMIWQLVQDQDNVGYLNFVATECDSKGDFPSWENLWPLLSGYKTSNVFLVLDGIEHSREGTAEKLKALLLDLDAGTTGKGQIHMLLSGTSTSLECLQDIGKSLDLSKTIETEKDAKIFVRSLLDRTTEPARENPHQAGEKAESTDDPAGTILDLLSGVKNYEFIEFLLGKAGNSIWPDERVISLAQKLNEKGENAIIESHIDHLNETLKADQIQDLNGVIPWLVLPTKFWPTLKQIEDIIILNRNRRPLKSLRGYIRDKFKDLLYVQGDHVESRVNGYYRDIYYKKSEESSVVHNIQQPNHKSKFNQGIHLSEIEMVKRFLTTICGDDLYRRFGFDQFFMEKSVATHKKIDFNPTDGHIKIITACLKAVCDKKGDDFESIREYCAKNLPLHLAQLQIDTLSVDQAKVMARLLPRLYRFFKEREVVESWFKIKWIQELREVWFSEDLQKHISKWFCDPIIIGHCRLQDFPERLGNPFGETTVFLKEPSIIAARCWLGSQRQYISDIKSAIQWILSFIKQHNMFEGAKSLDVSSPSSTNIEWAELWAKEQLEISTMCPSRTIRTGILFSEFGCLDKARERFDAVISSNPPRVIASYAARSYATYAGFTDAKKTLETLQSLFDRYKNPPCEDKQDELEAWYEMGDTMSDVHCEAGEIAKAIEICQKILEKLPQKFDVMSKMLCWMHKAKQYEVMVRKLQDLALKDLVGLFRNSRDTEIAFLVASAASKSRSLQFFRTCREALQDDGNRFHVEGARRGGPSRLLFCFGLLLTWYEPKENCEEAIRVWEQILDMAHGNSDESFWEIEEDARAQLATVYIQRARENKQETVSEDDREKYFPQLTSQNDVLTDDSDLLLARFHHTIRRKHLAVKELSKKIDVTTSLLPDDTDSNDCMGYETLAKILTCLDMEVDAKIAWTLAFGYDLERNVPQTSSNKNGTHRYCSGYCGTEWDRRLQKDLYRCRDCIDTDFCETCWKERYPGWNECSKDHAFLHIPEWNTGKSKQLLEKVPDVKEWRTRVLESLEAGQQ